MFKNQLRDKYKKLRMNFTEQQIDQLSVAIANQVVKLPIWESNYYHLFLPILKQKEVDTEHVLTILFAKNKEVVVGKTCFKTQSMEHFLLTDNTKIQVNHLGIPEPVSGLKVDENQIDVVFVPLLAFDRQGNRVGYGQGFYDGFLSHCKSNVIKVGLSFFEPEPIITDVESHDVGLDFCVTPKEIYKFHGKVVGQ